MITILATIFVLGVLIFIHELGHFSAAKLFRIRVDRFSMGFPPRLIGKKVGETDYCISAIPFGGYVKIAGMVDESLDQSQLSQEPQPWEFRSKSFFKKYGVVIAGPLMNIGLAFFIFIGSAFFYGIVDESDIWSGQVLVLEDKPAAKAGILSGDYIVSINGEEIETWERLTEIIHHAPGDLLEVVWQRGDSLFSTNLVPELEEIQDQEGAVRKVGMIGIGIQPNFKNANIIEAFREGCNTVYYLTRLILVSIWRLITGKESIRSLAGPVMIGKMAGDYARSGFGTLIGFMAILSLNLGILNLLPFPVLDGGHVFILIVEAIIRRPISIRVKLIIQQIGMVLLLGLMFFVIYNDIIRIVKK